MAPKSSKARLAVQTGKLKIQGTKGPMEKLQAQLDSKRMTAASTAKAAEKASGAERIALLGLQNTQESQVLALEQRLNLLIKGGNNQAGNHQGGNRGAEGWWLVRMWNSLKAGVTGRPHLREYGNLMAPRDLAHAKRCSFAVVQKGSRNKTKGISMGFFLGPTTCITALHAVQDTPLGCSISIAFRESVESEIAEEMVTLLKTVESLDLAIMQSAQQHPYMPLSRLRSDDLPHLAVSLLSFKWNQGLDLTSIQTQSGHITDVKEKAGRFEHSCNCVPGNSGAALVLRKGCVIGMHVEGENCLKKLTAKTSQNDQLSYLPEVERGVVQTGHGILASAIDRHL